MEQFYSAQSDSKPSSRFRKRNNAWSMIQG